MTNDDTNMPLPDTLTIGELILLPDAMDVQEGPVHPAMVQWLRRQVLQEKAAALVCCHSNLLLIARQSRTRRDMPLDSMPGNRPCAQLQLSAGPPIPRPYRPRSAFR